MRRQDEPILKVLWSVQVTMQGGAELMGTGATATEAHAMMMGRVTEALEAAQRTHDQLMALQPPAGL